MRRGAGRYEAVRLFAERAAAAEQTCADEDIARQDVFELVAGLVDKSVLAREEHGPRVRYRRSAAAVRAISALPGAVS